MDELETMLANRTNSINLIPQRDPIIMVHDLLEATDDYAVSNFMVDVDNIFVLNGVFTEPGLIENIAQTAAAQAGYLYQLKNIPVPVGFIAAITNLKIFELPLIHSKLKTTINVTNKIFEVTLIKGVVENEDKILCTCEMKIFTKSEQKLL